MPQDLPPVGGYDSVQYKKAWERDGIWRSRWRPATGDSDFTFDRNTSIWTWTSAGATSGDSTTPGTNMSNGTEDMVPAIPQLCSNGCEGPIRRLSDFDVIDEDEKAWHQ
ncbi:hypothetical protein SLS53_002499 [Cytospora paraplurivora]|uniref:Uncharacterized protein n=1 Tax=Cytospora paraplurivora TaxID=2898453 RepID=A0AAN9UFG5_9PEZI